MGFKAVKKVDENGKEITNLKLWLMGNRDKLYFDSKLERECYLKLKEVGFNFTYQPPARELSPSFNTWALSKGKSKKVFKSTIRNISYTTDFAIHCDSGATVFVEAKGYFHPDAKLRYKLFQATLVSGEVSLLVFNSTSDLQAVIDFVNNEMGGSSSSPLKKNNKDKIKITKL